MGFCMVSYSQEIVPLDTPNKLNLEKTRIIPKDSLVVKKDTTTIKNDSIIAKNEFFEGIVTHNADSLIRQDLLNNKLYLYKNAHLKYMNYDLKAGVIIVDNKNNTIYAKGIDSVGHYSSRPVFSQNSEKSVQDSIIFNFKTKKAKTWNLKTEQEGLFITGGENKKYSDSIIFLKNIKVTSSDKKNPDYYIKVNKAKFIKDSKLVAGMSQLVIADVPTPVILPFVYFPLTKGNASGFLIPTWNESSQQGYSLQNGGYYFAFNDYFDIAILGDIYSNGSWGLRIDPRYKVRYKYSGSISFKYQKMIYSIKGFSDYSKRILYNLSWQHSQDSKANPNSRFSANVDLGSSKYYRESLNELDNDGFLQNTLSSSISYSKDFVGTPFHTTISLRHSQNTNTQQINMTLPSLTVTMDKQYPFAGKGGIKKTAFQNIGVNYNMNGNVSLTTTDDDFLTGRMFDDANYSVNHTANASTNIKLFKYFTLNPGVNYKERWFFKGVDKTYNSTTKEVETSIVDRFGAYRTYSGSASLSTRLYGMFDFRKGKIETIRHIMTPSISYSYTPDFGFYNKQVQQSDDPTDILQYSPFEGGSVQNGVSSSLNISVSNNIEAKLRKEEKEEGKEEDKKGKSGKDDKSQKIKILNSLNFSTSYNMAADSLKWSAVSMSAGTSLFKNKLNLNFNGSLDPYALSATGTRINKWNINNGGSLFRITRANMSASYSISSKELFGGASKKSSSKHSPAKRGDEMEGGLEEKLGAGKLKGEKDTSSKGTKVVESKLYRSEIPWNVSLSYNIGYSNSRRENTISSNSLTFSGNIELTPKWKVGFSSGYDLKGKGITHTSLNFARDLDSWRMTFNWSPTRDTYYFFIGVKSQMLSDLKYDQRKTPDKRLF